MSTIHLSTTMATPEDFLWGVAIASHQNEGSAPASDWSHAERAGKMPHASGPGTRFRELLEEDLDRAAFDLGCNAFRTSIEWARLEPRRGVWDKEEVAYLHRKFRAMRDRGMKIVATLQHYTHPQWLYDGFVRKGWESPRAIEDYTRYARFVASEFGSEIDYYVTFNEPVVMLMGGYFSGKIPPFHFGPGSLAPAARHLIEAHGRAYEVIHAIDKTAKVSFSDFAGVIQLANGVDLDYTPGSTFSGLAARVMGPDGLMKPKYLDYFCLHYYGKIPFPELLVFPLRPYNLHVSPDDFARILRNYHEAYQVPILIGETGLATNNHAARHDSVTAPQFMVSHVAAMQKVMAEGVPILGHFWWTLTDNYEWGSFAPRFGLYRVECQSGDFTRVATPAVETYRAIIKNRGVTPELMASHGELPKKPVRPISQLMKAPRALWRESSHSPHNT